MKISVEIPDEFIGLHIRIVAGQELVAYKYADERWQVKTDRCNQCGECCKHVKGTYPPQTFGVCDYLKQVERHKYICTLGVTRPFTCLFPNERFECAEKFEEAP